MDLPITWPPEQQLTPSISEQLHALYLNLLWHLGSTFYWKTTHQKIQLGYVRKSGESKHQEASVSYLLSLRPRAGCRLDMSSSISGSVLLGWRRTGSGSFRWGMIGCGGSAPFVVKCSVVGWLKSLHGHRLPGPCEAGRLFHCNPCSMSTGGAKILTDRAAR